MSVDEKARDWFWRPGADFALVCDCAGLSGSRAVAFYAQDVIHGGGPAEASEAHRFLIRSAPEFK